MSREFGQTDGGGCFLMLAGIGVMVSLPMLCYALILWVAR